MQLLQAWSTTGAVLILLLDQQAVGATKKGAEDIGATLVIHVGPHKTGTTTIQNELASRASLLKVDGWTFPHGRNNKFGPARCYFGEGREKCNSWLKAIAMFKKNSQKVVISDEAWCKNKLDLGQLASDLSELNTTIIMFYRPFYEWIGSVYRQKQKGSASPTGFARWLSNETMNAYAFDRNYVTSVYSRYAAHFSDVRVHTMGPSLMTDIVCDDLNASRTCSWFRTAAIEKKNVRNKGPEAGECLNPAQQHMLERLSIDLHRAAFGIFSPPPFPTSDFHDQASHCFGTR